MELVVEHAGPCRNVSSARQGFQEMYSASQRTGAVDVQAGREHMDPGEGEAVPVTAQDQTLTGTAAKSAL